MFSPLNFQFPNQNRLLKYSITLMIVDEVGSHGIHVKVSFMYIENTEAPTEEPSKAPTLI